MIYDPENIRLREVDSRSGRRFKVSYYFRSLDVRNGGNPVRPLGELELELFPMRAGRVSVQASRSPLLVRYFDEGDLAFPTVDRTIARHAALMMSSVPNWMGFNADDVKRVATRIRRTMARMVEQGRVPDSGVILFDFFGEAISLGEVTGLDFEDSFILFPVHVRLLDRSPEEVRTLLRQLVAASCSAYRTACLQSAMEGPTATPQQTFITRYRRAHADVLAMYRGDKPKDPALLEL